MPWFKIDDGFPDHPKTDAVLEHDELTGPIGLAAIGLWSLCGSWCMKHLTDGHVPRRRITRLGGDERLASVLVDAGLWVTAEGGWQFVDWKSYQPTRREVEQKRKVTRERVTRHRASKKRDGNGVTAEQRNAPPDPTRPDPTRPVEESARDGSDSEQKTERDHVLEAVRVGYERRFLERLAASPSKGVSYYRGLGYAADWVEATAPIRKVSVESLADALLDGFFANPKAAVARFPMAWLGENPNEYAPAPARVPEAYKPPPEPEGGYASPEEIEDALAPMVGGGR